MLRSAVIHTTICTAAMVVLAGLASPVLARATAGQAAIFHVAPNGDDHGDGSASHPFRTLERAQAAVRTVNASHDVTVEVANGTYLLADPMIFRTADGGQGSHKVVWQAAPDAQPVLSGGVTVSGFSLFDAAKSIYVADVPTGSDPRQLWINGVAADRAAMEIPFKEIEITATGFRLNDPNLAWLADIKDQGRLDLEMVGIFTDRFAPVETIQKEGDALIFTMQQPSWDNNTWGYDTPSKPFGGNAKLILANAPELFGKRTEWHRNVHQWYVDPAAGKLYVILAPDEDITKLTVTMPRLETLVSVAGTYDAPVHNLTFRGLGFAYSGWRGPSMPTGYASQQSGAYIREAAAAHTPDAYKTCGEGCPAFETMRQHWSQIPAAVQVAAARQVTFDHDRFSQIGQIALGIGNDANANISGVGLGTDGVVVSRSHFAGISGSAIMAGGVQKDAHHPSDPRMTNKNLTIANNTVSGIGLDFKDNAGILVTYFDGAQIAHNDVADAYYDGIDIGWGWGYNDAGGNPNYRDNQKGYTVNPLFDTPTILRNVLVTNNRVHGVKKYFIDGGAIYNLSSTPGTVIQDNYVFDIGDRIGIYLDEGSKHVTVRNNVVETQGWWLNANTVGKLYSLRITSDNRAIDNWHDSIKVGGRWNTQSDSVIVSDIPVPDRVWPAAARAVIAASGIEPERGH